MADGGAVRGQLTDRHIGELAKSQLDSADILVLNKMDLVPTSTKDALVRSLQADYPDRPIVVTVGAAIDPAIVERPSRGRFSAVAVTGGAFDALRRFQALYFVRAAEFDREALESALARLPDWILRVKGIVHLAGHAGPYVLYYAGGNAMLAPLDSESTDSRCRVIAIALRDQADPTVFDRLLSGAGRTMPTTDAVPKW